MRNKIAATFLAVTVAVLAFRSGAHATGFQSPGYVGPKPVRSYPSSNATIQRWISTGNNRAIRAHGWDIWQSITATTASGQPTWQTWYSGHELFEMTSGQTRLNARARHGLIEFTVRPTTGHVPSAMLRGPDGIPFNGAERTFAFNRFSQTTAQYIWNKRLNSGNTLRDTLIAMANHRVPLISREVLTSADSTDSLSFVLKPVFQFISGKEVTAVPYWNGDNSSTTYDSLNPVPSRWRQAVAVDPTGRLKAGDSVRMVVNNEQPQWLKVVPLSAFYHITITREDSANFTQFGAQNGDFIGVANDTSYQAVLMAVRPGNIGLLMAMHTTGKEIPNWTWQSFWWGYNPNDPQFGADRPRSIGAPWNHYNMTIVYSMTDIAGKPIVAFNPYLETSLEGKIPNGPGNPKDSTAWSGIITNCMSCHRRAAIGYGSDSVPVGPPYGPAAFVSAGDPVIFTQPYGNTRIPVLKTDFLWSVAIRASTPSGPPPKRR